MRAQPPRGGTKSSRDLDAVARLAHDAAEVAELAAKHAASSSAASRPSFGGFWTRNTYISRSDTGLKPLVSGLK